jgi:hypothetical protein
MPDQPNDLWEEHWFACLQAPNPFRYRARCRLLQTVPSVPRRRGSSGSLRFPRETTTTTALALTEVVKQLSQSRTSAALQRPRLVRERLGWRRTGSMRWWTGRQAGRLAVARSSSTPPSLALPTARLAAIMAGYNSPFVLGPLCCLPLLPMPRHTLPSPPPNPSTNKNPHLTSPSRGVDHAGASVPTNKQTRLQ